MITVGDLFYEYVIEAFNAFTENHAYLEIKCPTSFESEPVEYDQLFVSCEIKKGHSGSEFCINVSHATVQKLKTNLNLDRSADRQIFRLRIYWIIHHEIAHWLWGHIRYYQEQGWATELGLSETEPLQKEESQLPQSTQKDDTSATIYDLAHAAELQADTFATIELFNLISRNSNPDEYDRHLSASQILFAIMSTVAMFYEGKEGEQPTSLHPTWDVRSINLMRSVFECHLVDTYSEEGIYAGLRLTAEALNPVAEEFAEKSLYPTLESCHEFARAANLSESLFPLDTFGLLNPTTMIKVMSRSENDDPRVDRLLKLYDKANDWIEMLDEYSPVHNFQPVKVFGESMTSDPNEYSYKLVSEHPEERTQEIISKWAQEHNLSVKSSRLAKGPGIDEYKTLVDIIFQTIAETSPDQLKAYMDYLKTALKFASKQNDKE